MIRLGLPVGLLATLASSGCFMIDHCAPQSLLTGEEDQEIVIRHGQESPSESYRLEFSRDSALTLHLLRRYDREDLMERRHVKRYLVRCTGGVDWNYAVLFAVVDGLLVLPMIYDLIFLAPGHDLFKHTCNYNYNLEDPQPGTAVRFLRTNSSWKPAAGTVEVRVGEGGPFRLQMDSSGQTPLRFSKEAIEPLLGKAGITLVVRLESGGATAQRVLSQEDLKILTLTQ